MSVRQSLRCTYALSLVVALARFAACLDQPLDTSDPTNTILAGEISHAGSRVLTGTDTGIQEATSAPQERFHNRLQRLNWGGATWRKFRNSLIF